MSSTLSNTLIQLFSDCDVTRSMKSKMRTSSTTPLKSAFGFFLYTARASSTSRFTNVIMGLRFLRARRYSSLVIDCSLPTNVPPRRPPINRTK